MGDAVPKTKPRKRGNSSPWMPRLRKRGEKLLHSKYVVILVIILTITDCSLVIAELILDLYSVKKTLLATEEQTFTFIRSVRSKYPEEVRSNDTVFAIFERIAQATIVWNNSKELDFHQKSSNIHPELTTVGSIGMTLPSLSGFASLQDKKEATLELHSHDALVQRGNNLTFVSNRHFRRQSQASNSTFRSSNPKDNNENLIRTTKAKFFRSILRVKRYLPTIIQRLSDNLIANGSIVYNNDNEIVTKSGDGNRVDVNNESGRFLRDLQLLRQMSEHLTMHLSQSKHQSLQKTTVSEDSVSPVSNAEEGSTSHSGDHGNVRIQNAGLLYSKEADAISTDWSTSDPSTYSESVTTDFSAGHDVADDDGDFKTFVHGSRSKRSSEGDDDDDDDEEEANMRRELHHNKEMEIAHKLHYASVCVVSILVIEVTMKIVCAGSHFLKRKIEVFDAVVIVTSVVVDLIFIKGLTEFAVDDSIFVLALLLPWRVIRVVNSLVMAVIDHEHVKLRLLYSRKKKLDKTVESLRNEVDELKGMLQDIRSFCIKEGIESSRIDGLLGKFAPRRRKDSKFYTLVKLVMSTASINNNDNESISSSSMENDLRHYSNRDSVLNEVASNDGTISSLKQYLSVPFSNGESRSVSDVESVTGDQVNTSPSIYITSPLSEDGGGAMFSFCDVDMEDNDIVTSRHDATECIEEEDSVATIDVTSSTTNINAVGGVAFYVGSQTSFNFGYSQGTTGLVEHAGSQGECFNSSSLGGPLREAASSSSVDANKNVSGPLFGQFLTVPHCAVNASPGSSTTSISFSTNNNLGNEGGSMNLETATHSLPQDSAHCEMRRSVSDTTGVTSGYSMCRDVRPRYPYGSPVPVRRSQEGRALRRIYRRHKSESEDNESIGLLKRDSKGRMRRNSGDPQSKSAVGTEEPKRARSHSPSPKTLLNVPGNTRVGGEITCSSSRSMCDVSFTGNQYAQNLSMDGKILRRSCLSLNSEGRKRRGKSPHRVSFKVS